MTGKGINPILQKIEGLFAKAPSIMNRVPELTPLDRELIKSFVSNTASGAITGAGAGALSAPAGISAEENKRNAVRYAILGAAMGGGAVAATHIATRPEISKAVHEYIMRAAAQNM